MRERRIHRQDGGTLVIVLLFISVFGLVASGLLTESSTSVKFTTTVANRESLVYAADAGVSYGMQQIRQNPAICPRPGASGPGITNMTVPSQTATQTVQVTCSVNSGSTGGVNGYAVITTSTGADSLKLSNSNAKKIDGDVFVNGGVTWGPGLNLTRGNFYQQKQLTGPNAGTCLNPPGATDLTIQTPPYDYYCQDFSGLGPLAPNSIPHVAPPIPTASNPNYVDHNTCRVFSPGVYTSPPTLRNGDNYFVSGIYYFNFTDSTDSNNVIDVKQATIYGGQPANDELAQQRFPLPADCAGQDAPNSGTGVEFVFGSKARMFVDTQGSVELFGRRPATGTSEATSGETQNISFIAVPNDGTWPTGAGNWAANTVTAGTNILDIKDGNQQDLAVHGLVYAYNEAVGLTATNSVLAQTMGGLLAYSLELKSSASAQGLAVAVAPGGPTPRQIVITATATSSAGGRPEVSTAVVQVANDDSRTITVQSWRTRGVSDPV